MKDWTDCLTDEEAALVMEADAMEKDWLAMKARRDFVIRQAKLRMRASERASGGER